MCSRFATGTVESHDVYERGVRAGNQCDQSDHDDRQVFGHGPTAHALPPARRSAATSPPLRPVLCAGVQIRVFAHGIVVPVKVQIVLGIRVLVVLVILVTVFPEREQVDDGRAHEAEDGEEHRPDERDERCQVGHERGDEHCGIKNKKFKKYNAKRTPETKTYYIIGTNRYDACPVPVPRIMVARIT